MGSQGNEPVGMTPLSPTSGKECFSKDNFLLSHQPGQTEHPGTAESPKQTLLEQIPGYAESLFVVADIERDYRSRCVTDLTSHIAEAFNCKAGNVP